MSALVQSSLFLIDSLSSNCWEIDGKTFQTVQLTLWGNIVSSWIFQKPWDLSASKCRERQKISRSEVLNWNLVVLIAFFYCFFSIHHKRSWGQHKFILSIPIYYKALPKATESHSETAFVHSACLWCLPSLFIDSKLYLSSRIRLLKSLGFLPAALVA